MDCTLILAVLAVLFGIQFTDAKYDEVKRHYIYWDSYVDPRLKEESYGLNVEMGEFMDIVCPLSHFGITDDFTNQTPFYLYNVTKEGFRTCDSTDPSSKLIFACDLPDQENKLTIKFQTISPSPYGFRFRECEDYYFIAVKKSALAAPKQPGCAEESERLRIHVKCSDEKSTTTTTTTTSTTTTTTAHPRKTSIMDRIHGQKDPSVDELDSSKPFVPIIVGVTPSDPKDDGNKLAVASPSRSSDPSGNGATSVAETNAFTTFLFVAVATLWYSFVTSSS